MFQCVQLDSPSPFHFSYTLLIIWFSKNFSFLGQVASKREVVETLTNDTVRSLGLFQFFSLSTELPERDDG